MAPLGDCMKNIIAELTL